MMIGMSGEVTRDHVRDRRIQRAEPLVPPSKLSDELPLRKELERVVVRGREDVVNVLNGDDDRPLVVVGPCSVHDVEAAIEYGRLLTEKTAEVGDDLLIAMRVYFEKPRTTTGWKGLINDPHLDDSGDVNTGLRMARTLLLEVLGLGLPIGVEFLDPITPQYISDTVAWGPIGFKNRTDGNVQVAVDAVRAAAVSHAFAGVDDSGTPAILYTTGNPDGHV